MCMCLHVYIGTQVTSENRGIGCPGARDIISPTSKNYFNSPGYVKIIRLLLDYKN